LAVQGDEARADFLVGNVRIGLIFREEVSLPAELGFMAVIGPLPILEMFDHHRIMSAYLRKEIWNPYQKKQKEVGNVQCDQKVRA
jgi:hypothetical protein